MASRGRADRQDDRSAGHRISRLLITAVSVTMLLMAASVSALLIQHARIRALTDQIQPTLEVNRQLLQTVTDAQSDVRSYAGRSDATLVTSYQGSVDAIDTLTARLDTLVTGTELPPQLQRQRDLLGVWRRSSAAVITGDGRLSTADNDFAAFRSINAAITDQLTHRAHDLSTSSELITIWVVAGIMLLSLAEVIVLLRRGLSARRAIGPPLENLHAVVAARRRGDLSARADPSHGVIEIRTVATEVNDLIEADERRRETLLHDLRLADAVREIGMKVGGSLDLATVISGSAEAMTRHFRAETAWVRTFDPEDRLLGVGMRSAYPPAVDSGVTVSDSLAALSTTIARRAWAQQTAIAVHRDELSDDFDTDQIRQEVLGVLTPVGTESMLIGAIGSGQECLGLLALGRGPGRPPWSAAETAALVRAGQEIGQAVVHARLFQREENLLAQARSLEELKGDFVATVSHELRTPLTSIVGNVELVRSGDVGETNPMLDRCMASIERNSRRLTLLVEDLLLLSQVEQRPVAFSTLCVRDVIADAVAGQREVATKRGIGIDVRLSAPIRSARVVGNEVELERLIGNVLGNAVKFSPPGSPVVLTGSVTDESVAIAVRDEGIGISADDQRNLFTKFFRSTNPVAHKISGTGLGLTICKHIADEHGGTIEVSSELGAGTTITVTLPLAGSRGQPRRPADTDSADTTPTPTPTPTAKPPMPRPTTTSCGPDPTGGSAGTGGLERARRGDRSDRLAVSAEPGW